MQPLWTERAVDFEFMLCAAHFIGDGMALHATANDFFGLLGSEKSNEELEALAAGEWKKRWEQRVEGPVSVHFRVLSSHARTLIFRARCTWRLLTWNLHPQALPRNSEKCFPKQGRLRRAVGQVGFQQNQEKQIVRPVPVPAHYLWGGVLTICR